MSVGKADDGKRVDGLGLVGCVVAVEVECGYFKLWGEYKWRRSTAAKSVDS